MAMQLAGRRVALAVGIILLAIGTVAVVSIVKQRGETARNDEIVKIATDQDDQEGEASNGTDTQKSEENTSDDAAKNDTQQGSEQDSAAPAPQAGAATPATELPQTGPADYLAALPLGLMTFAALGYLQSRRLRL